MKKLQTEGAELIFLAIRYLTDENVIFFTNIHVLIKGDCSMPTLTTICASAFNKKALLVLNETLLLCQDSDCYKKRLAFRNQPQNILYNFTTRSA